LTCEELRRIGLLMAVARLKGGLSLASPGLTCGADAKLLLRVCPY
jgi:hypothetical protein